MKISALSERSGVTIASIKFYLREGLLFAGQAENATRTDYDETHVGRLRLIRALIDVGGLSITAARAVIEAIDDDGVPIVHAFGIAQHAVSVSLTSTSPPSANGLRKIEELKNARGWQIHGQNPGETIAARVIDAFVAIGRHDLIALLPAYAEAAEIVAAADLGAVLESGDDRRLMVETVVVGTALGDGLFAGLRRVAQENVARSLGLPGSSLEPSPLDQNGTPS
ncbi:MAG: MerR family transcriptional regulator [Pseudolysinimonas sp.]